MRAVALVQAAASAWKKGKPDLMLGLAREAMREDPKSADVQGFYGNAVRAAARHERGMRKLTILFDRADEAIAAGRVEEGLDWARKAAATNPGPEAVEYLKVMENRAAKSRENPTLAQRTADIPGDSTARDMPELAGRKENLAAPAEAPDRVTNIKSSNFTGGFLHYVVASGNSRRVDFNEINTSGVRVVDFPAVATELRKPAHDAQIAINSRLAWTTSGFQGLLIGDMTLLLKGKLTLYQDCRWTFQGSLRSFDDTYDFNKARRKFIAEVLTTFGRNVPGKRYKVEIRGVKPISDVGTKETCP